jgi:hypothetical protein
MKHQLRNHLDGSLCTRKRHALEEEIKKPEERGLIEKSSSPWSSQVVMEEKKDEAGECVWTIES